MDNFITGFQKVASKVELLKHLAKGKESSKGILDAVGAISKSTGSMAGQAVEGAGAGVGTLGKLMQKYPGAVVPGAAGLYVGGKALSSKSDKQRYVYPQGYRGY